NSGDSVDWFENELITLSIPEINAESLTIFPIPTRDVLNFEGVPESGLKIEIYDVIGKSIMNTTVSQNSALDVSSLESGIYVIKFENFGDNIKFIKQ
ncbi:MAG: T9SS type A sorting domain-containing protein, partial [Psychroserpens sp.]|nr:T9SS type A sorting domain-containing protein [Psychroserpens sp.]